MRKKRKSEAMEIDLGKVITPFLDMAFQLLVFFIFTYHPSATEMQIDVSLLPPRDAKPPPGKSNLPPPKTPKRPKPDQLETEENYVVIVEALSPQDKTSDRPPRPIPAQHLGEPRRILLQRPENPTKPEVIFTNTSGDKLETGLDKLKTTLRDILASNPNSDKTEIDLKPDGGLTGQYVTTIKDLCQTEYGVEKAPGNKEILRELGGKYKKSDFKKNGMKILRFTRVNDVQAKPREVKQPG